MNPDKMLHLDLKTFVLCLIGLCVAGSTCLNLKTWRKARQEQHQERLVALLVYLTLGAAVILLCVAAWTGN